jgi:hypothetical protein
MTTPVHPNCGCCGQPVVGPTIYWTVGGTAYHPNCYPKAGCKVCVELRERAERERDAALDKVRAWIDMIENCAGVPQNPDSLPQMLLHEMRKLLPTPSERESTP